MVGENTTENKKPFKSKKMEFKLYETKTEFEKNYLLDYSENEEINFLRYLNDIKDIYIEKRGEQYQCLYNLQELTNKQKQLERLERRGVAEIWDVEKLNAQKGFIIERMKKMKFYDCKRVIEYLKDCTEINRIEIRKYEIRIQKSAEKTSEIILCIGEKIENEKLNLLRFNGTQNPSQPIETPEIDFSGKDELKPKQKLIILNELGVIDFINDKLQDKGNATHLSEILNTILGVETKTLRGYVNLLIRPDETQRNSPYNSKKVVSETMQILNKFKLKENGSR